MKTHFETTFETGNPDQFRVLKNETAIIIICRCQVARPLGKPLQYGYRDYRKKPQVVPKDGGVKLPSNSLTRLYKRPESTLLISQKVDTSQTTSKE